MRRAVTWLTPMESVSSSIFSWKLWPELGICFAVDVAAAAPVVVDVAMFGALLALLWPSKLSDSEAQS